MTDPLREMVEREMLEEWECACPQWTEACESHVAGVPEYAVDVAVRLIRERQQATAAIYEAHGATMHACPGIRVCGQGDSGLTTGRVFAPPDSSKENGGNVNEYIHQSDCSIYNGPALPVGECDCRSAGEGAQAVAPPVAGERKEPTHTHLGDPCHDEDSCSETPESGKEPT